MINEFFVKLKMRNLYLKIWDLEASMLFGNRDRTFLQTKKFLSYGGYFSGLFDRFLSI